MKPIGKFETFLLVCNSEIGKFSLATLAKSKDFPIGHTRVFVGQGLIREMK